MCVYVLRITEIYVMYCKSSVRDYLTLLRETSKYIKRKLKMIIRKRKSPPDRRRKKTKEERETLHQFYEDNEARQSTERHKRREIAQVNVKLYGKDLWTAVVSRK